MINAIINSIDDTANADVIELSVPDIYKASISSGSVNVSPLVFERIYRTELAEGSRRTEYDSINQAPLHLRKCYFPKYRKAGCSHQRCGFFLILSSALSTGIISLDTYGNVTNIVASTTPGIAKVILTFVPNISLNHLITG